MNSHIDHHITEAVSALRLGQVLLYPTDTIWGLGCDMTNKSAVERIYEIKQRPKDQPVLILVSHLDMLKYLVDYIHPRVETLLSHHLQPLTLIYKANEAVPEYLTSEDGTIAIRIVQHDFCREMISALGRPIISTSANITGQPYPKNYAEIQLEVRDMVDYIVSEEVQGQSSNMPSIIARYNKKGELEFLRD